jgi:hypothetical protein
MFDICLPSSRDTTAVCGVLVLCATPFQAFLSLKFCIQFLSISIFKSFVTSSVHLFFGRMSPTDNVHLSHAGITAALANVMQIFLFVFVLVSC